MEIIGFLEEIAIQLSHLVMAVERLAYPEVTINQPPIEPAEEYDDVVPQDDEAVAQLGKREQELVDLAKRMGYQYLIGPENQLVVDNRVLQEYARRNQ